MAKPYEPLQGATSRSPVGECASSTLRHNYGARREQPPRPVRSAFVSRRCAHSAALEGVAPTMYEVGQRRCPTVLTGYPSDTVEAP